MKYRICYNKYYRMYKVQFKKKWSFVWKDLSKSVYFFKDLARDEINKHRERMKAKNAWKPIK